MKIFKLILLAVAFVLAGGCASKVEEKPLSELDLLLEKIERAVDPENAGAKIKAMRVTMDSVLTEQNMKVRTSVTYRFPNQVREEGDFAGMMNVVTIFDGQNGVEVTKDMGSRKLTEAELLHKKFDLLVNNPQLSMKQAYPEITLAPEKVTVNGKSCYHLTGYPAPEFKLAPVQMYFDAETYLMVRQEMVTPTPMGDVPMSVDSFDYRDIEGLFVSTRAVARFLGSTMSITVSKVEFNPSLSNDTFKVPDEDD